MLLPNEKVFYFRHEALPTPNHPEFEKIGKAFIKCWIVPLDLAAAEALAKSNIEDEMNFRIINNEIAMEVKLEEYTPDSQTSYFADLYYYRQAASDHEVTFVLTLKRKPHEVLH